MSEPKIEIPFRLRLRAWQKKKGFKAKDAAAFLGVELVTFRHWLYDDSEPSSSPCLDCIEKKMKE